MEITNAEILELIFILILVLTLIAWLIRNRWKRPDKITRDEIYKNLKEYNPNFAKKVRVIQQKKIAIV